MFQLNQVACAYEQKKVFTGLDLEIRQGQYVMLMGENGTGKSSLISLLTGFKQEESGRILFLGKDLKEWLKDKRRKRDFYSRLGILFQDVDSQLFNRFKGSRSLSTVWWRKEESGFCQYHGNESRCVYS